MVAKTRSRIFMIQAQSFGSSVEGPGRYSFFPIKLKQETGQFDRAVVLWAACIGKVEHAYWKHWM